MKPFVLFLLLFGLSCSKTPTRRGPMSIKDYKKHKLVDDLIIGVDLKYEDQQRPKEKRNLNLNP
jgi:hypothetical protein